MSDATASAILTHAAGLHARPSLRLTMLAKTFPAKIEIALRPEGPWIDAKSIVKVMASKAPMGSTLHFRAAGENAQAALDALVALVDRDFDDDAAAQQSAGAAADG